MSRGCPEEEVSERAAKRGCPEGDPTGSKTHGEFRRWVLRNWNDSPKEGRNNSTIPANEAAGSSRGSPQLPSILIKLCLLSVALPPPDVAVPMGTVWPGQAVRTAGPWAEPL